MLKCLPQNKGFSLLELIIAVAILSVGIIVVLQAFSFSAQGTGLSCDIINAVFLAEDKIQELEFREAQQLITEETARDTQDKFDWHYSLTLDRGLDLYKFNLGIDWQRQHRQEGLELNSYLRK